MERPKEEVRDADEVVREYYERDTEGAFRADGTEPVSPAREQGSTQRPLGELSGGDPDAVDVGEVGAETPTGSNPTPDHDIVDEIGRAAGIQYQDNEPLKFGDKMAERDVHRWELNPASSEDYQTRSAGERDPEPTPGTPAGASKPRKGRSRTSTSTSGKTRRRKPRA